MAVQSISNEGMIRSAEFSRCGRYRYLLGRRWGSGPHCRFVMLNPSTADAARDDPTIRRCIGFAQREGFGGLEILNLFAFRATRPADLVAAPKPVGARNPARLKAAILEAKDTPLILGWGAHKFAEAKGLAFTKNAARCGAALWCLGVSQSGAPRHPLYVRRDEPLAPWN